APRELTSRLMRTFVTTIVVATLALATLVATLAAQTDIVPEESRHHRHDEHVTPVPLNFQAQLAPVKRAGISLPIAGILAAALAFRPRRPGTPRRTPAVIQTQIILALVGAVVMLIVGQSLARAFGIVGAAGLVRYRAKIEDPKDAGVMLSTLAVGLASGVGMWLLATFATGFILVVLWIVESMEPKATDLFTLRVKAKDPAAVKGPLDALLTR